MSEPGPDDRGVVPFVVGCPLARRLVGVKARICACPSCIMRSRKSLLRRPTAVVG